MAAIPIRARLAASRGPRATAARVAAALAAVLLLATLTAAARQPGYATAWLEYQLRGNATAAGAFTGPHPELVANANWPGSAVK